MALRLSFSVALGWRVAALFGVLALSAWLLAQGLYLPAMLAAGVAVALTSGLARYVNDTNRRLVRLFESIRYGDFAVRFSSGAEKGDSFREVNRQFNEVLDAFRQARAEKEASLLFINTVVQHLSAGLLVFDAQYNIVLSNPAALNLLGIYRLQSVADLPEKHQVLTDFIRGLATRDKLLYQPDPGRQLSVQGLRISLQGRIAYLVTLQNIHPELQRRELDAWRDLTRVLRHEIMNSITPIVSTIETMQLIVDEDLKPAGAPAEAVADLAEALALVAGRSRGLVRFVDAYRSFTSIPKPDLRNLGVKEWLERSIQLVAPELRAARIGWRISVEPEDMMLRADEDQLSMVLLNLVKNAREALQTLPEGHAGAIALLANKDSRGHCCIVVQDNGPGIDPSLLEDIFIPFFSGKPEGSGIGLSISRQIIEQHGGHIGVQSTPGQGAAFSLVLPVATDYLPPK